MRDGLNFDVRQCVCRSVRAPWKSCPLSQPSERMLRRWPRSSLRSSHRSTRRPRPRSRMRISWTSGPASTSSGTHMLFATAGALSGTAPCATAVSCGAPRVMCIPLCTGAGSGSSSRPRWSVVWRPAADAESKTACTNSTPTPAACFSRSATALCASFARCASEPAALPPRPAWPEGRRVAAFDPERDALAFHAAQQEAFADHWEYIARDFESWSKSHLTSERFDPALWCVVKAGDEIAAGTICTSNTYGGGFVQILFTRRLWRRHGIGASLVADAFCRFWTRGERSVGLGVDAESGSGAFRLYERAGMTPALGWVQYEKQIRATAGSLLAADD